MVPIWRKNKNELTEEDYTNFYFEKRYGFDKPIKHIHISADGAVRYNAILFIPEQIPFNYYTVEYEKGLELYSSSVLIMNKCPDLIPDYFSFVKGMVDSEDLSLNISREMLQHDRQLKLIARNIKNRIKSELLNLLKTDREKYEQFYDSFGRQLKYGIYRDYGSNKEILQDLLMFYSSKEKKMITLSEYILKMKEEQKYIYYATGESNEKIAALPQTELLSDKGFEILYLTDDVDEFALKVLESYEEKEFRSVSGKDLGIEDIKDEEDSEKDINKELFEKMKNILSDEVKDVRVSKRLKSHPVCLINEGEISIEMEKVLRTMPDNPNITAEKVLEINEEHDVFKALKEAYKSDEDKFTLFTKLLYNQALLIEGLSVDNPVEFSNDICKLMI